MAINLTKDHHLLTRNLKLNDHYISNDGDNEGFSMNDAGYMQLAGTMLAINAATIISPTALTASSPFDYTLNLSETLNLGAGEASGYDSHFGIFYNQTQTNTAGWDNVYLMYLFGGDAARTFAIRDDGKVGIGINAPTAKLEIENTSAAPALKIDNDAAGQIALEIEAVNTTAPIISIVTATPTEGNILYFVDNSSSATARDCVAIAQLNPSATGATALDVTSSGGVTGMTLDKNVSNTNVSAATFTGLEIDFDHTVPDSGTATQNDIGINLDLNSATLGTSTSTGIDIDVVGDTSGTHTLTGIDITCTGADKNHGLDITVADGANDYHMRLFARDDPVDYCSIATAATGATTIATKDATVGQTGHIILSPDGEVRLNSGTTVSNVSGIVLQQSGTTYGSLSAHHAASHFVLLENQGASEDDFFEIKCEASGLTTLSTVDDAGEDAHLILDVDGIIKLSLIDGEDDALQIKNGARISHSFKAEGGAESVFTLYESGGDSYDDYFQISTTANGATTLTTVDDAGADAHLTLSPDGQMKINSANASGANNDGTLFQTSGTTFGAITSHHALSNFTLYEAGGSTEVDYFNISVDAAGATTISTVDDGAAGGHLTLDPDGELNLTPANVVKSDAPLKIKEAAAAVADTGAYGQLWVKDETPNELYFTTDAGDDIQLTDGTSAAGGGGGAGTHYWEYGGRARTQYNNWYWGVHITYGIGYYYLYYSTSSTSLPSTYIDSYAPAFLAPRNGTITGYTIIGNMNTTDTWEWALMKGTQPTFGSAGNWSLSQIGATQSAGGTSNILYKWEQTGLSVALNKNDMVMPVYRRTTDDDSSNSYSEFSMHITLE